MKTLVLEATYTTASDGIVIITLKKEANEYHEMGIGREFNWTIEASNHEDENLKWYQTSYYDYKTYQNEKSAMKYFNSLKSKYHGMTQAAHDEMAEITKMLSLKYGK